jgi:PhoH-like ATPase
MTREWLPGNFIYLQGEQPFQAIVRRKESTGAIVETLRDFTETRHSVWGITARNREQNFALNLLMDPDIDLVTLLGTAGTGKTLLTLAAALTQTLDEQLYKEIIMTRVTVPVGEDIGFLPGTEEEKMTPWMGALMDNLEVLTQPTQGGKWARQSTDEFLMSKIKIKSLNFMRGRTFLNRFIIIDEAQNLTPKQMKTLITRAGPGTKVVCLGNIAQIDTPYLTETSSGLTYVVDRFKGWEHAGHITLQRGERSRLADFASDNL